jgi:Tfp pilus assembly protein PilF
MAKSTCGTVLIREMDDHQNPVNYPKITGTSIVFHAFIAASLICCSAGCQTFEPKASQENPEVRTHLSTAYTYIDAGQANLALDELRPLVDQYPDDAEIQNLMGLTQLALNNPTRGLFHLRRAVVLKPTSTYSLNLSSALIESGNLDEAQKILKNLLKRRENPPYPYKERIYQNLGLVAEKRKHYLLAEKFYRRALVENPTYYMAQLQLGHVLAATNQRAKSIEFFESAAITCPACYAPVDALVTQYVKTKQLPKAAALLERFEKNERAPAIDRDKSRQLRTMVATLMTKKQSRQ